VHDIDSDQSGGDEAADAVLEQLALDLDEGFVALVRTYESLVYSVALRTCDSPDDAEDLAAETFTRAYRALRDFPAGRIRALRPRAWLATIVLNAGRNHRRDQSRRPQTVPMTEAAEPTGRAGEGGPADDWVNRDDDERRLAALLAALPDIQRTAVMLRHIGQLSIGEVAEVLRCPEGTAKSHISRGLHRLRSMQGAEHHREERGADYGR